MVSIYTLCDVFYNSFYIEGFKNIYRKVESNTDRFTNFAQGSFAVLIVNENQTFKATFITNPLNKKNIKFEGGIAPINNRKNFVYKNLILDKIISLKKYILNIKKSPLVFNTSTVLNCHGWKLGELLALGKAITATQHTNDLLFYFIDNQNVLYANKASEIKSKIDELVKNKTFWQNLENNARQFYNDYLAPKGVMEKLLLIENF